MFLIDDLSFDGEQLLGTDPGADRTARMAWLWNELARQRHVREAEMDDVRTQRLARLMAVGNLLEAAEREVKTLYLAMDQNAVDEDMERLLDKVQNAKGFASFCRESMQLEMEGAL